MTGTVYGLGIGPGDPELITLKALRLLETAPVIAYPAPDTGDSLARAIVADYLKHGPEEIAMRMPMRVDRFPAQDVYDAAAARIVTHLEAGRNVVVLCEGDPFFYGSFMFLFGRLAGRFPVEVVPGVTSLVACAAALGAPLAARNDTLTVIPAPLPAEEIRSRLVEAEAAAIIKLGRHFSKVNSVLAELGLCDQARYVEHATMQNQKILPLSQVNGETPYFSMILMHRRGAAWQL